MLVSGTRLGGALNPLSSHTPKHGLLLLRQVQTFFPDSLLARCGALAPFRLCSCSQPQASALSPHQPRWVSRQAPQAGECWSALILCMGISHFALSTPVTVLSSMAPKLPPCPPPVAASESLPSVWKLFLLHSSFPEEQVLSLFLCLCFFLFSFDLPRYVGSFLSFGRSDVFCQHPVCVL